MIDAGTYGAANWVDLSTPDVAASTVFYQRLMGWDFDRQVTPMGEYFVARMGEREVGGMMEQGPELRGTPAVWTVFFYVEDIETTVAAVADAGGQVLEPPFDIPGDARVAVVADPTGAMFALISGPRPDGIYLLRTPGSVCWVELLTRDPAAAESFYAAVFGWKGETTADGTAYTMFELEGREVAGMMMMPEEVPPEAPAHWATYFAVTDCEAVAKRADELGGTVLHLPTEVEIGRFAVLADVHGATFHVLEFTG